MCLGDRLTGQYANATVMIGSLLGQLKIEARGHGWEGLRLHDAIWTPAADGEPDQATITVDRGPGDVTVDDVSKFLREKKRKAT